MRGYLSFVLVFLSVVLLFSMLNLNIKDRSTKSLLIERAYSTSMNVKESVFESINQGAASGFTEYDISHDVSLCKHCPDHYCSPEPPNECNQLLCEQCFRIDEARFSAKQRALSNYEELTVHDFDPDFQVSLSPLEIEIFILPDQLTKNGYSYQFYRIEKEIGISIEAFNSRGSAKIPRGFVYDNS